MNFRVKQAICIAALPVAAVMWIVSTIGLALIIAPVHIRDRRQDRQKKAAG